jgi:hypothetical protein
LDFSAGLRAFQHAADEGRALVLDKTLPGWTQEAREMGFRKSTRDLQNHHHEVQSEFKADFEAEALSLERELMARLGIAVRHDGEPLVPLHYDAADYLEDLARRLAGPR